MRCASQYGFRMFGGNPQQYTGRPFRLSAALLPVAERGDTYPEERGKFVLG